MKPELAAAILSAPTWAKLGIGVRDPRLQERAAHVLAERVVDAMAGGDKPDSQQLVLPIVC